MNYRFWHSASGPEKDAFGIHCFQKEKVEWEGKCLLLWALVFGPGKALAVGSSSTYCGEVWILGQG